jgi:Asp-tRNA(Asn)/Glu-tRNA(Gln) amidotransferase A subunit family amidase
MRMASYFDVKGFLDAQTQALAHRKAMVEKRVMLRGGQLETTRVPNVDWEKELQIFYQTDINKPALRDAYQIDSVVQDDGRLRRTYLRKPETENQVERLTVVSAPTAPAAAQEITATLTQDNPLFFSRKRLALHTVNGRLLHYEVQGVQKLVLFDTLRYSAAGRVLE